MANGFWTAGLVLAACAPHPEAAADSVDEGADSGSWDLCAFLVDAEPSDSGDTPFEVVCMTGADCDLGLVVATTDEILTAAEAECDARSDETYWWERRAGECSDGDGTVRDGVLCWRLD